MNTDTENIHEDQDEGSEATIVRLCARFNLNRAVCLDMIDEVMEAFAAGNAEGRSAGGTGQLNAEGLAAARKLEQKHRTAWFLLTAYQAKQKTVGELQMSTRAMALELGYSLAAGATTPAELAKKLGMKKQTVNKCTENFQSKLELPPRDGQRGEVARANMSEARIGQLKVPSSKGTK